MRRAQAYDDVRLVQVLLGDIQQVSRSFMRWNINQDIESDLKARTDGSDAFDTLCIGVERYPVSWGRGGQTNEYPK